MIVSNYNILETTWIYQDIKQQVEKEAQQKYLVEQKQMLLEILQERFPRIVSLAKSIIKDIEEWETLKDITVNICIAGGEREVRRYLLALDVKTILEEQ